ncbi:glycosyltransferase family 2 protein [Oceanospirillaceae bacterium G-43]|uniref:Glycosyltransferase family 2 protein n=1 Tax=Parathalassolituus penaei TaxID=2997323 RepID=A0A9X3EEZ6_9GAMM|nr:glycosyltransferase family 2 protein [Parathalassolituus penaei]MCY0966363.1 glycosyltransferase family 2 protein [Parathalassolituus penaei]
MISDTRTNEPRFLITVPTWQRAHLLDRLLVSLQEQSVFEWQLLLLDDCSSDDTPKWVQSRQHDEPRLLYRRNPLNLGCNGTRNTLLQWARELDPDAWMVMLDDDDFLLPNALENLAAHIARLPDVRWFAMTCQSTDSTKTVRCKRYGMLNYLQHYMFGKVIRGDLLHCIQAAHVGDAVFTERLRSGEEWFFFCHLAVQKPMFLIDCDGAVKDYQVGGLSNTGINRARKQQVLELKIQVLEPLVGTKPLLHQLVSLARIETQLGHYERARLLLSKTFATSPFYVRQYRHWLKLVMAQRRSV